MKVMPFCILLVVILFSGCENPATTSLSLPYETKIIDIGPWDMSTGTIIILEYVDYDLPGKDSIIGYFTSIVSDDGNYIYPIDFDSGGYSSLDNYGIVLGAIHDGLFQTDPAFNGITSSRGTVTVFYRNN